MVQDLNVMMKDYMDGLSVKVFRTFNASITLDRLLFEESTSTELVEKKADYDRANKEVRLAHVDSPAGQPVLPVFRVACPEIRSSHV
jgi:MinD superfamily P-loop ATPase